VNQFEAARARTSPDDGTQNDAIAEMPNAMQPTRLTAAIFHSSVRLRVQSAWPQTSAYAR
jgi:hypothetical protein